jgi:hypothetical protein
MVYLYINQSNSYGKEYLRKIKDLSKYSKLKKIKKMLKENIVLH